MANVLLTTLHPNYPRLAAMQSAGITGDAWLPQGGDPDSETIERYVLVPGNGIYWVPDWTYCKV
jgi:hypothetical protein